MTDAETISVILAGSGLAGCGMAAAGLALRKAVTHAVYAGYSVQWSLSVKPPPKPKEPAPVPAEAVLPASNGHGSPALVKGIPA